MELRIPVLVVCSVAHTPFLPTLSTVSGLELRVTVAPGRYARACQDAAVWLRVMCVWRTCEVDAPSGGSNVLPIIAAIAMSYDIALYDKSFLKAAIDEDLDDYTVAPPLPSESLALIKDRLLSLGYTIEFVGPSYEEYVHPNGSWGLQVSVYESEIAFSIPYWDDADSAVAQAKNHARLLALEFGLGMSDQQDGELIY